MRKKDKGGNQAQGDSSKRAELRNAYNNQQAKNSSIVQINPELKPVFDSVMSGRLPWVNGKYIKERANLPLKTVQNIYKRGGGLSTQVNNVEAMLVLLDLEMRN